MKPMKKRLHSIVCTLLLSGLLAASGLRAQSVSVEALMDSMQIFIGHQTEIRLKVFADANQKIEFPVLTDTLVQGIEILKPATMDTVFMNDRKRVELTQTYLITSFDSALYYIPPFHVQVDGEEYTSKALALKVYSVPVDEDPEKFFGLRGVMKPAFSWEDWSPLLWLSLLMIMLTLLAVYLGIRLRDNKPLIRFMKPTPKLPPHQLALQEIERIKLEKTWEGDREKEYYTQLTDTLRAYIKDRFHFNATEMTSAEIISRLMEEADSIAVFNELKTLFTTADLVKFAKWKPDMTENDYNLVCAIEFVNETKQLVEEKAPDVPVEVKIEQKRSKRMKILLWTSIFALSAGVLFLIFYLMNELSNLLL